MADRTILSNLSVLYYSVTLFGQMDVKLLKWR